jgi:hypothetical protein
MAKRRSPSTRSSDVLFGAIPGLSPEASIAFREAYVSTGLINRKDFTSWASRLLRYSLLWAFFEGTAYSPVHRWSVDFRKAYGLYAWTRNVFNVAFRLGEFWAAHLMGGALDPNAGDGKEVPSALPIRTTNALVRTALAQLWADSLWQTKKDIWTRWGAVLGDTALVVCDDRSREKVYLRPITPASLRYVETDYYGNVKGYIIEEMRPDPAVRDDATGSFPWASYTERCTKDGDEITFETLRNGVPYDWEYQIQGDASPGATWTENYGFVPMVTAKHLDVGAEGAGWAEFQPSLPMAREIDDLGSVLTDQARRILNAVWLMNAPKPPEPLSKKAVASTDDTATATSASASATQISTRGNEQFIWNDPSRNNGKPVTPYQLVGNMPIGDVGNQIDRLMRNLEKFYPELQLEGETTGDSGRARRVARQKTEAKVHARRAPYDAALVRAHMMAMSIGGKRSGKPRAYPGYENIDQNSFENGQLAHSIAKRPVFATDPMDEIEEEQSRWTVLRTVKEAGGRVSMGMRRLGFSEEEVGAQEKQEAKAEQVAEEIALAKANARPSGTAPQPMAQESKAAQNRGANAPTDLQGELYARPGVPFETRQGA